MVPTSSPVLVLLLLVSRSTAEDLFSDGTAHTSCEDGCDPDSGASLNLLQIGLEMKGSKMSPSLEAEADKMLTKDLALHREKVAQWKSLNNRTLLTKRARKTGSDTETDKFCKLIDDKIDKAGYNAVKVAAAGGVGSLLDDIRNGKSPTTVASNAASTAIGILSAAVSVSHPYLGMLVTMAGTLLSGMLPGDNSDPMGDLYETIMNQVADMINSALIAAKLETNQDALMGISDELAWLPSLVTELDSDEISMSYFLMVQHDLAVNSRAVFGACFDDDPNAPSNSCLDWQKAGTVEVALDYAQMHIELLAEIYMISSQAAFRTAIGDKMYALTKKYRCLLKKSYEKYYEYRETQLEYVQKSTSSCATKKCNRRRRNNKKCNADCCTWTYKIKDNVIGNSVTKHDKVDTCDSCSSKGCTTLQNEAKTAAKSALWNPAVASMKNNLLDVINALSSKLTTADYNSPCNGITR